jgi:hypothetical protein
MRKPSPWLRIALAVRALALGLALAPGPTAAQDDAQPPAAVDVDEDHDDDGEAKTPKPGHAAKPDDAAKTDDDADESSATEAEPGADPTLSNDADDERTQWRKRAAKARAAVEKAQARVAASLSAYQNMRQRNFPRGDAAAAIEKEVVDADKALKDAESAVLRLEEDARSASVPTTWIEPD